MAGAGQITQYGGQLSLNKLTGLEVPHVGTSAPSPWIPGQYWIDNTVPTALVIKGSNDGVTWNVAAGNRYLALLVASPASAVLVSDLVEVALSDYSRAPVTFAAASAAYPSVTCNTNLVTWGPFAEQMLVAATYVALVSSASGTSGSLLYWWSLPEPILAPASQPIQIPIGSLTPGAGLILDQA